MSSYRIIRSEADLAEGAAWLSERDPHMGRAISEIGTLPLRLRPDGFKGLLDIIVSQQVSVASADAIRLRMAAAGVADEGDVQKAGEAGLRALGFSRAKARYALALAERGIDYGHLRLLPDGAVIERLCEVKGIGPWTAQVYVMFCLGRADVLPAGDLALQEAARALYALPERPAPKVLAERAEAWSPWRSVAARALFAYYRLVKNREGL
ncbi:MAG: DNA-3-methyladenine glycosylase 2 family protein [Sulfitobacter sp.]|nr:DNA-3-methyladenine glycosylase 2 family protein [Sulfitobacter sp.]